MGRSQLFKREIAVKYQKIGWMFMGAVMAFAAQLFLQTDAGAQQQKTASPPENASRGYLPDPNTKSVSLRGEFMVTSGQTAGTLTYVLVNPRVIAIGNREFLAGETTTGPDLVRNNFDGLPAYLPLDRIEAIDQVK
ncbi:MAG: hypothetical protein R3C49_22880 [Planctomycetaceae bacterium]